jgi:hypothetical protein
MVHQRERRRSRHAARDRTDAARRGAARTTEDKEDAGAHRFFALLQSLLGKFGGQFQGQTLCAWRPCRGPRGAKSEIGRRRSALVTAPGGVRRKQSRPEGCARKHPGLGACSAGRERCAPARDATQASRERDRAPHLVLLRRARAGSERRVLEQFELAHFLCTERVSCAAPGRGRARGRQQHAAAGRARSRALVLHP